MAPGVIPPAGARQAGPAARPRGGPRRRKHADLRREEILRATVTQIESHGIHDLRMSDVARALSVSPALIVYHFQTKEALIAEAFTLAAQQDLDHLEKLTAGLPTALRRLSAALDWYAPTGRAKGWRLWIEGWAAALREPELRQVGREVDLRWKESLIAIIQDGVHSGEFATADPRGAAWRITALMDGLAVQTIVHRGIQSEGQGTAWARQLIAHELGVDPACLADQSPPARTAGGRLRGAAGGAGHHVMPPRERRELARFDAGSADAGAPLAG